MGNVSDVLCPSTLLQAKGFLYADGHAPAAKVKKAGWIGGLIRTNVGAFSIQKRLNISSGHQDSMLSIRQNFTTEFYILKVEIAVKCGFPNLGM
jgi:hypothetical protein